MIILNVIIILSIISILISLLSNNPPKLNTLQCGIWGFSSAKGRPGFSWVKFDWIGVSNDPRGGDACGRVYGDIIDHSNKVSEDTYGKYISKWHPQPIKKNVTTIFGHNRKASFAHSGKGGLEYTQPIVYQGYEFDEKDEHSIIKPSGIDFMFSHNGTLYNHNELAEEYGIGNEEFFYLDEDGDLEGVEMNDSQILGHILGYKKDQEVLKKYKGTAAFALYDYKTDELILWSGESKNGEYSHLSTRERPLFVIENKNHMWFSSVKEPLLLTQGKNDGEIREIPTNTLLKYKDGILIDETKIDRSNCYQTNVKSKKNKDKNKGKNHKNNKTHSTPIRLPGAVDEIECYNCDGEGEIKGLLCRICNGTGLLPRMTKLPPSVIPMKDKILAYNKKSLQDEDLPSDDSIMMHYARGKFMIRGDEAHGIYHLNTYGCDMRKPTLKSNTEDDWKITKAYYFIQGHMILGHEAFTKWTKNIKKTTYLNPKDLHNLSQDCTYPIYDDLEDKMLHNMFRGEEFNGWVEVLFSSKRYFFENGNLETIETIKGGARRPNHGTANLEINELPFDKDIDSVEVDEGAVVVHAETVFEEQEDEYADMIAKDVKN
ncbi:MAG: class II glutamine amidotransferase, partial [Candidatus Hodarchaeales archaeon]